MKKTIQFIAIMLTALMLIFGDVSAQTVVKKKTKKGWSHKKKGVVIGAGAGAVTGALISNKKGKGALIGGAVGAGAGYLYGRHKDKKDPRRSTTVKYKTKQ
jgi:hypothetical protein